MQIASVPLSFFLRFELVSVSLFCLNQGLGSPQISFWRTPLLLGIPVNSLEHTKDSFLSVGFTTSGF